MVDSSFENDQPARKIISYLLFIEILALIIAFVLTAFKLPYLAFCIGSLTFLIFVGILFWLYRRFLGLEESIREPIKDWRATCASLARLIVCRVEPCGRFFVGFQWSVARIERPVVCGPLRMTAGS